MERLIFITLLWLTKKRIRRFIAKYIDRRYLTPAAMVELFDLIPTFVMVRLTHDKLDGRTMEFPGTLGNLNEFVQVCKRMVKRGGSIPPFVIEENFRDLRRVLPLSVILLYTRPGHILCETYENLMGLHELVDASYVEKRYHYEGRLVDVYTAFIELVIEVIFAN